MNPSYWALIAVLLKKGDIVCLDTFPPYVDKTKKMAQANVPYVKHTMLALCGNHIGLTFSVTFSY